MSGTTYSKFYWADWESDPALRLCSLAAQGLWMRMLCIAASHDPTGYICIAGQGLGVTDLARLTGASETEVAALLAELSRYGVFSRDAKGRIYSRRMVRDVRRYAQSVKNGKKGGNPTLSKEKGNSGWDNPPDKGRHNTQKPEARRRDKLTSSLSPSEARTPTSEPDGSSPSAWGGPAVIRAIVVAKCGEAYAVSWLDPCGWQDVPERLITARTTLGADRLWRDFREEFQALEISIGKRAA